MRINKCKQCGGTIIDIVTEHSGATKAVCRRCGNAAKPANLSHKRLAQLANKQAEETREVIKELAIESWNKENP